MKWAAKELDSRKRLYSLGFVSRGLERRTSLDGLSLSTEEAGRF
jgi:hypothetical protein